MKITRNIPSKTIEHDLEYHDIQKSMQVADRNTPRSSGGKGACIFQFTAEGVSSMAILNADGLFHFEREAAGEAPRITDQILLKDDAGKPIALDFEKLTAFLEALAEKTLPRAT